MTTSKCNEYLENWITKAEFQKKYTMFTPRQLSNIIRFRHDNGFHVACKVIGVRAMLDEKLVAEWLKQQDQKST